MKEQTPSVNRSVHYVSSTGEHQAAIISAVDWCGTGKEALTVFPPMRQQYNTLAYYDKDCGEKTWHWPEYVPPKE